jgi:UDP-glucose 4-epimerase
MRIVVVGATGNVGTSVLRALRDDERAQSVLGIGRRIPQQTYPKVEWASADIARADLVPHFRGADAVIHLAWLIQPSRDLDHLYRVNVEGSQRVFEAVAEAGVPALVYASSVGAYSRGPKDRFVDESWPVNGITTSYYSRHKAEVEAILDAFERRHPDVRVARMRPGLIFKRESASQQRRLFAGPLVPSPLVRPGLIPFIPDIPRLRFQAVHSYDVGRAYARAALGDARGAFNLAAEPVLDPPRLARLLRTRTVRVPAGAARAAMQTAWRLRLQPSPAGWLDLALGVPLLDTTRARTELGWEPQFTAEEAIADVVKGIHDGAGAPTPPLDPEMSRGEEIATGVGSEE